MHFEVTAVTGLPEVVEGDRIGRLLADNGFELRDDDVLVVASKIVAKAEGRVVALDESDPGAWSALVRREAVRVLRVRGGLVITETAHGFVCANSGIDRSNVAPGHAVLLPKDPDNSAHVLRNEVKGMSGKRVGVVVSDTAGRAWRNGVAEMALGCAGIRPIHDLRGTPDAHGRTLDITQVCVADQIAAAAALAMPKNAMTPVVVVRGLDASVFGEGSIRADVVRNPRTDLFR